MEDNPIRKLRIGGRSAYFNISLLLSVLSLNEFQQNLSLSCSFTSLHVWMLQYLVKGQLTLEHLVGKILKLLTEEIISFVLGMELVEVSLSISYDLLEKYVFLSGLMPWESDRFHYKHDDTESEHICKFSVEFLPSVSFRHFVDVGTTQV